ANLRWREVRIDDQSGLLLNRRAGAVALQTLTEFSSAAVLPDDRVVNGFARFTVPDHRRLALVRNPEPGDVARLKTGAPERFNRDADLRRPDFLRIVFHPSRLRENLAELFLRDAANRAVVVEHDSARAGGALIESKNVGHGG